MTMTPNDRILGPARGSLDFAICWAAAHASVSRLRDTDDYVREVFRLAPLVGIDPAIVVAQSAHETGNWTSPAWRDRLNPAGIGITDGPDFGYRWESGTDAARGQIVHLHGYAKGRGLPETLLGYRWLDPRWAALADSDWAGTVRTIRDLTGKWATDPDYHDKIAAKGNLIFPGIPNQTEEPMSSPFPFAKQLTSRHNGPFSSGDLWITIHNNGNPNSDRFDEARFVASGGGASGVMYHGAIDAGGVVQIMPLDTRGVHAGNAAGNLTSIAFEMCEGSEPWVDVKLHTATLLAEIVTNQHGILDYGAAGPGRFSLDRVREHRDWPGANPNCPRRLIQTDGGVEPIVGRARAIAALWTAAPGPTPEPRPLALPKGMSSGVARLLFNPRGIRRPDGRRVSFNLAGEVSRAWLANALAEIPAGEHWTKGTGWDGLDAVIRRGDGRLVYQFGDFVYEQAAA